MNEVCEVEVGRLLSGTGKIGSELLKGYWIMRMVDVGMIE